MRRLLPIVPALLFLALPAAGQLGPFTHADTLRGSNGPARAWWDAAFYDLHARVDPADSSLVGWNGITYRVLQPGSELQIDLQEPLQVDSVIQDGRRLTFRREGNAFFVTLGTAQQAGELRTVAVHYHGKPRVAQNAPWDGGFVFARDSLGRPFIATACQGLGASVWWPVKDTQADEPDSQRIAITVPDSLLDVSNGRLRSVRHNPDRTTTFEWFVEDPINNYDVAINAAEYAHFSGTYAGEGGKLTLDFWPLEQHVDTARKQFQQVEPMLGCFEHWFGPYPWYRDGYKLVETPHLGMEHQSAVAYGNHYRNGYLGRDLSGTGLGLKWDFIIIHESAHEWFGNSLTTADMADMWVHEAFASYAESLFAECQLGKAAGATYMRGTRARIRNDRPIVAPYGVNAEGSSDMYNKGANMLHTIRQIVDDDGKWRGILRGLNREFYHKVVTGRQVQDYISRRAGQDLSRVFQQYLTTTKVPVLEYSVNGAQLSYRWTNVVDGFDMPVRVTLREGRSDWIRPVTAWRTTKLKLSKRESFAVDPDFYVDAKKVGAPGT